MNCIITETNIMIFGNKQQIMIKIQHNSTLYKKVIFEIHDNKLDRFA
jgi:hypothetical protein